MYVGDNKVWVGPMSSNAALSQGDWMGAMLSFYANATNVLFCPTAPNKGNPANATNPQGAADAHGCGPLTNSTPASPQYSSSYGYNSWLNGGYVNNVRFILMAVIKMTRPFKIRRKRRCFLTLIGLIFCQEKMIRRLLVQQLQG